MTSEILMSFFEVMLFKSTPKRLLINRAAGLAVLFVLGLSVTTALAQQKDQPAPAQKAKTQFKLTIKNGQITVLSLRAKDTKLSDIAADLSSRLKIPVVLSPVMQKQVVSLDFEDLNLEPAMQLLAPQVFIDYQVDMNQQRPLGIFLTGYNEPQPPTHAVVQGSTQALLIEGDTEDGVEPKTEEARKRLEEKPLRISLLNNNLTIHSKKQPLPLVLLKIGEELGIPVEIRDEPRELITTDIVNVPWEEALQRLSPNIRMYVRADLQRLDRRPLRLALMPSAQASQSSTSPPQ